MHDLASARALSYDDDDTQVVDVPIEEKVVMHVQLLYGDGLKHRLLPSHNELACDTDELNLGKVALYPEKLDGVDYCPVCFTPRELLEAERTMKARLEESEPGYGLRVQVSADLPHVVVPRRRARRDTRGYPIPSKNPKPTKK